MRAPQVDTCPHAYYDQIQGQLEILEKPWCDLVMYTTPRPSRSPPGKGKGPPHLDVRAGRNACVVRVERNQTYFEEVIAPSLVDFGAELSRRRRAADDDATSDALTL